MDRYIYIKNEKGFLERIKLFVISKKCSCKSKYKIIKSFN